MGADDRRSAREKVILTAEVEETAAGSTFPVRVSNVSQYGALVVGVGLPPSETEIIFRCNGLEIAGWIAWSHADSAGLQFAEPIETEKLAHRSKPPAAGIVKDERQFDFRRPGFRGNQMSDEERTAVEEWLRSLEHPSKR
jgi:hypothetical protein